MGITARLVSTIASEPDNPRHKTAGPCPGVRRAACSSPEWLGSIRSLATRTQLSRDAVTAPLAALSDSPAPAPGSNDPDQFEEDGTTRPGTAPLRPAQAPRCVTYLLGWGSLHEIFGLTPV